MVLDLLQHNLLSPWVLCFALGIVATRVRSDLEMPEQVYAILSIYLLLSIGLRGGVELSAYPLAQLWRPVLATLCIGVAIPLWCYGILRRWGRFSGIDAAAIAAHYGSVSAVTFSACHTFLNRHGMPHEGFMVALVALLEIPAIVVALCLARRQSRLQAPWGDVLKHVLAGKSMLLLIGGLLIGALIGHDGFTPVAPVFVTPFPGVLMLFLLELGMVTGHHLADLRKAGPFLVAFALAMPLAHGMVGVTFGHLAGLSPGGATVLGVLAASASYIAAPAAVRMALPEANPGYYLTATLAVTFPFNLMVGIPACFLASQWLSGI